MRILFTFVGGNGHFTPLLPIAIAARDAGHTVAFGAAQTMISTVEAAGFPAFVVGSFGDGVPERLPLLELSREREFNDLREGFARRAAGVRADGVIDVCAQWNPDLIVCDEVDFGAMIAAERLGLKHVTVLVTASGSFVRKEVIAEPLHELRTKHGLPADPDLTMLSRHLVLSPFPPSFRDPAFPLAETAHSLRSLSPGSASRTEPPTVYFTLGTIFNTESGDLFTRVLDGLRRLPINLVVTVGRHIDPAEFGPQPDNIRISRFIPQAELLPHCDAVVSHGGSGSVVGTLAHGLPSVLLPMGADQPQNGDRLTELGLGRVLDAVRATPEDVAEAVHDVLADPAYRQAAERVRDEIAALPGPEYAVELLEALHDEHRAQRVMQGLPGDRPQP